MAVYRVYKDKNHKQFVETENLKFAVSTAKELIRKGHDVEIMEKKNIQWRKVKF